jgi:predicted GIY-YIG superfamily endonuclease
VLPGFNDLATVNPELAQEALFDATRVTAGSGSKGIWRCSLGHEWEAKVNDRAKGKGCPFCANNRVLAGFNDLVTTDPDLAAEALFDPTTVSRGSGKKLPWRCRLGHQWEAAPNSRSAHGQGCPFCSGKRVLPGFNDLATVNPELAQEALFDATKVTAGSGRKERWRCAEGHEWKAVIGSRTSETAGRGCPNCAKGGFHPERQAWLYLMHHDQWEMLQIGITNNPARRRQQHQTDGWTLIDIRGPMDGVLTQALERDILKFLKNQARVKLSTSRRSQHEGKPGQKGGEAWPIEQYRPKSLKDLVSEAMKWTESHGPTDGAPKRS